MKIVQIIPGSGGSFYCQNCVRDLDLLRSLRALGHDVIMAPLYLPLFSKEPGISDESPVFFGAVNVYLKQKYSFFRHAPRWIEKLLDSRTLLKSAAQKAGSVRASGLEDMTLSMLKGEKGNQASELDRLMAWLLNEKPDIVHLSNALLLGLVPRLKKELSAPVICSLQDEDSWIDKMENDAAKAIWKIMSEKASQVDSFIAVSEYYGNLMKDRLGIPSDKIHVVYVGSNMEGCGNAPLDFDPPVIGYLSRMTRSLGLDLLVEAFVKLKRKDSFKNLRLRVTGGQLGEDVDFLWDIRDRLTKEGLEKDVDFVSSFDRKSRIEFLKSLSVMSVPVPEGEAFGTYIVEALACGVPVVQPRAGAFPEVIAATGGGITYEPGGPDKLASVLETFLRDPDQARKLGKQGQKAVLKDFGIEQMAKNMIEVYRLVLSS